MQYQSELIPGIQLGDLKLGESINKILSLLKQKGNIYKHIKIINTSLNDPIKIEIFSEDIILRFDSKNQKLNLIEKVFNNKNNKIEYIYNNKIIFSSFKNDHSYYKQPDYKYIQSIFKFSNDPLIINNKTILNFNGISFVFNNKNTNDECLLEKIFIFNGNSIMDNFNSNLYKMNFQFKIYINKDIKIKFINNTGSYYISINQNLEDILHIFKNPNYNYNFKLNQEFKNTYNFIINYYNLGLDLFITNEKYDSNYDIYCNIKNKVKRIILHNNNIFDSSFGIYDRCNFIIEIDKSYFYDINQSDMFKNIINQKNNWEIERSIDFYYSDNKYKNNDDWSDILMSSSVSMKNNILIYPWSNFGNIIDNIPKNYYKKCSKTDDLINRTVQYYIFDKIIFIVHENNQIGSIIIYNN